MMEHPQVVHFPIALLSLALFTEIFSYFIARDFLRKTTLLLLSVGVAGAFVAIQTGEADAEIVNKTSDIVFLLKQHEAAANWVLRIFGLSLILKSAMHFWKKNWLSIRIFISLLMLFGFIKLYQAGNFGGTLVYEKGVGVNKVPAAIDSIQKGTEKNDD